ncbi:MAG: FixH family protein [Chloroflexi bacterium]|nr:FixH family protein [Chloroflexota bacterium]
MTHRPGRPTTAQAGTVYASTPRPRLTRRRALVLAGQAAAFVLGACTAPTAAGPRPSIVQPTPPAARSGPTLIVANAELVTGKNRFAAGLVDESNRPITEAQVAFDFYQLVGQEGTKRAEAEAVFRWVENKVKGIYTAPVTFEAAGRWGVEAHVTRDGSTQVVRVPFEVKATSSAPTIGDPARTSRTPTIAEVADPTTICTAMPPCQLHQISVADAVTSGRPTVVLFASPGYCTSATCSPQLHVLLDASQQVPDAAHYVHVEIYKDPRYGVVADAVAEWGLPSEPWLFFVDRAGTIVERFDGIATTEEIAAALAVLA